MADDLLNTSPRLADRLEAMDNAINAWRKVTQNQLLQQLLSLNLQERIAVAKEQRLRKSVGSRLRKKDQEIEAVGFSFSRHGIYLEHGVGRGRPVGSSKAAKYKKPWLSVVLPPSIDDLADILEDEYANIAVAELRFNIPGIISSKVSGG